MIIPYILKDKKVVVAGLGKTGLGAAKSLIAANAEVYLYDDNEKSLNDTLSQLPGSNKIGADLSGIAVDYVVLSPGIQLWGEGRHILVKTCEALGVEIISDIDLLYLSCPNATFVGITGTNGKSTTTALIGHILKESGVDVQVGGNIGISVMQLKPFVKNGVYVLELSSFQLDLIKYLKLDYSVVTNITSDHIDRHLTMIKYVGAKRKILDITKDLSHAAICIDYPETVGMFKLPISTISCKQEADFTINARVLCDVKSNLNFDLNDMKYLPGQHNEENIACAYVLTSRLGIAPEKIIEAIKSFSGLEHRLEKFYETSSVVFVNDSKATNANSTEKALHSFDNIHLILGGKPKEGGIESIARLIKQKCKMVYLIGYAQKEFAKTLDVNGIKYEKLETLERVVDHLKSDEKLSGVVLLSPACASYDQFANFEQRGIEFKRLVLDRFRRK